MSVKNLDENGVLYLWQKVKAFVVNAVSAKVDKVSGKGLSTNDLTSALKQNYDAAYTHSTSTHAPSGAQANVIELVKVNGAVRPITNKAVDITVPDISGKVDKEDGKALSENNLSSALKAQYDSAYQHSQAAHAPAGAQANIIEIVKVNGEARPITSKAVDIAVPDISGKVDKEDGKELSTNDLTNALKTQYDTAYQHSQAAHAPSSAEENIVAGIKKNGVAIAPVGKVVDISVPTKVSQLTNDSSFATQAQVAAAVAEAGHLTRQIVTELPAVASADFHTIYMVPRSTTQSGNSYDEYMVISGAWEKLGNSDVDLTNYLQTDDVTPITNTEIDAIVAQ